MLSSAMPSSSAVVMPARTCPRSSSSVWPTTRPAARIASICSGVLISMPRSSSPIRCAGQLSGMTSSASKMRCGDLGDLAEAVDLVDDAARPVDLDQRLGLLEVDLLAAPDDVLGVVGAALDLGALQQPRDDLVLVDGQADDGVELVAGELDHPVELLDLRERARVAVEEEAGHRVGVVDAVAHHEVGDLVRDVLARVHVALGLEAELRPLGDVGAEDVAGRDRRDLEVLGDELRLRALARPGRTHDDQAH